MGSIIMLPDLTPFGVASYTAQSLRAIGQVAQLVERGPEKAGVGGSIPSLATTISKANVRTACGSGRLILRLCGLGFVTNFLLKRLSGWSRRFNRPLPQAVPTSPRPEISDSFFEKMKRYVLSLATGSPQLLDHAHGAIGIEAVHHYSRGPLQVRIHRQERSYSIPRPFI